MLVTLFAGPWSVQPFNTGLPNLLIYVKTCKLKRLPYSKFKRVNQISISPHISITDSLNSLSESTRKSDNPAPLTEAPL